MKKMLYITFLFLSASCVKVGKESYPLDSVPIGFSVGEYNVEVKGSELTEDNISSFGVFAALEDVAEYNFNQVPPEYLQPFMSDVRVEKTAYGWTAVPVHYYWPVLEDKTLSFFAYAPHSEGIGIVAKAGWAEGSGVSDKKTVELTYSLDSNPAKHIDLCVASAVLDRVRDADGDGISDPVAFDFQHTLATVSFAANYIGTVPSGCYLRIDELTVGKFVNSNTLVYNSGSSDFFAWDPISSDDERDGTYALSIGSLTLDSNQRLNMKSSEPDKVVYTEFVTLDGIIYVLPQDVNPAGTDEPSKIDVTFSYVKEDGNAVIAQFYTSIDLPATTFQVAKKYMYQFTLDLTTASLISISCVDQGTWVTDWKNSNNTHEDTMIK